MQAKGAGIARPAGRDRHALPDEETGNALAHGPDRAGDLVPEDHRFAHPHRAEAAVVEVVQVRPANAARLDGDLDLPRSGQLLLMLLDAQIAGGMDDDCLHRALLRQPA